MRRNIFLGFGCSGYRSFFGSEDSRFGPFDKVQVLAGQNNCGKSSLVDFVIKAMTSIDQRGESESSESCGSYTYLELR